MEVKAILEKLPQWKSILSAIVGLGAMCWVAYNHFTTDAEAAELKQEMEQKVDSAFNQLRADEARKEVRRLELRLLEEPDMLPAVKEQILRDIAEYKTLLRCVEDGVCR